MKLGPLFLSASMVLAAVAMPVMGQPASSPAPAQEPAKKPSKGEQQALKWFNMLDTNRDGRISREEAKLAFRLSPAIAEYFRDADLNGDGYLTEQEIRTVAERRRAERQRQRERQEKQQASTSARSESAAPATTR